MGSSLEKEIQVQNNFAIEVTNIEYKLSGTREETYHFETYLDEDPVGGHARVGTRMDNFKRRQDIDISRIFPRQKEDASGKGDNYFALQRIGENIYVTYPREWEGRGIGEIEVVYESGNKAREVETSKGLRGFLVRPGYIIRVTQRYNPNLQNGQYQELQTPRIIDSKVVHPTRTTKRE